ncbi:MAG: DUF4258 domain-containing protein [Thermotogota bacterium]|nr:DUF4258 domain-containing protein [Thermotogota bacterium]
MIILDLIEKIRKYIEDEKIQWRGHILSRMIQRRIKISDVLTCLQNGEIIEEYNDDYPFPSCLVLGYSNEKPFHVVCSIGEGYIWMITVYSPDGEKWNPDYKTRRNYNEV